MCVCENMSEYTCVSAGLCEEVLRAIVSRSSQCRAWEFVCVCVCVCLCVCVCEVCRHGCVGVTRALLRGPPGGGRWAVRVESLC